MNTVKQVAIRHMSAGELIAKLTELRKMSIECLQRVWYTNRGWLTHPNNCPFFGLAHALLKRYISFQFVEIPRIFLFEHSLLYFVIAILLSAILHNINKKIYNWDTMYVPGKRGRDYRSLLCISKKRRCACEIHMSLAAIIFVLEMTTVKVRRSSVNWYNLDLKYRSTEFGEYTLQVNWAGENKKKLWFQHKCDNN